jgi:diaminopimelate decarboxylase
VKANSNLEILRLLARLGSGFDVVSGGELYRLQRIGVPGRRIVFSGVGKTREEIREALRYTPLGGARDNRAGILLFNVESAAELDLLAEEAARRVTKGGRRVPAAIRVNPDVQAGGHPHISTGYHLHKFGVDWNEARRLYLAYRDSRWIVWQGISAHIGSQILRLAPFRRALGRLAGFVRELARAGVTLKFLDFGGGLGIRYAAEEPPDISAYAREISAIIRPLGCHLLLEPGRVLVGPAGILLTRVLYTKRNRGKTFVVVDAAMNDFLRPALYGATHPVTSVARPAGVSGSPQLRSRQAQTSPHNMRADVVGPVCETADYFVQDWPLDEVASGDLLVIWGTGAYAFVSASNYNSRLRAPEVLVEGNRFRIIRRRESRADLLRCE